MESLAYRLAYWLYDRLSLNWFKRLFNFAEGLCVAGFWSGLGACVFAISTLEGNPGAPWWTPIVLLGGIVLFCLSFPLGMIFGDVPENVIADMGQK